MLTVLGLCLTQPSKGDPHLREAHVASKWRWPPRLPWTLARGGDASDGADDHPELPHSEGLFQETGRVLDGEGKGCFFGELGADLRPEGAREAGRGKGPGPEGHAAAPSALPVPGRPGGAALGQWGPFLPSA